MHRVQQHTPALRAALLERGIGHRQPYLLCRGSSANSTANFAGTRMQLWNRIALRDPKGDSNGNKALGGINAQPRLGQIRLDQRVRI